MTARVALLALALAALAGVALVFLWPGARGGARPERTAARVEAEPGPTATDELAPAPLAAPVEVARRVPAPPAGQPKSDGILFTLFGRVLDTRGVPVAGAQVTAHDPARPRRARPQSPRKQAQRTREFTCATDDLGRFRFEGLVRGPWSLAVVGAELESLRRDVELGPELGELVLTVARGDCLAIDLAWSDGTMPQETRLTLVPDERGVERVHAGRLIKLCALAPGRVRLEAQATAGARTGFAAAEVELPTDRPLRLLLTGPERILVRGRVNDERGAPVPGARLVVALDPAASAELDAHGEVRLSGAVLDVPVLADGSFALELEPGRQWIGAFAREYSLQHRELSLDGPPAPLEFVLTRLARIEGIVLDEFGLPAKGATVEGVGYLARLHSVPTKGDGRFSMPVTSGTRTIFAREGEHAPSEPLELHLGPGQHAAGLVLRLREGARVEVRVRDHDGTPLADALVLAGRRQGVTDAEGHVAFERLAPERLQLQAWYPGLGEGESDSVGTELVPVPGTPNEVELAFPPRDPVRLTGRIDNGPGGPGRVSLTGENGGHAAALLPDGSFSLVLTRPGRYRGSVSFVADRAGGGQEGRQIEFTAPDTEELFLRFDWLALPAARSEHRARPRPDR